MFGVLYSPSHDLHMSTVTTMTLSGVLKEPLSISEEHSGMPPSSLVVPLNKASFTETGDQEEDDVASQDESSGGDGSLYLEPTNIPASASGTPLRNAPVGSKGISSELVKMLESHAHEPYTCILTRATNDSGFTIARSHIIPRSVRTQEVGDAYSLQISILHKQPSYVRVNGCSVMMQVLLTLTHTITSHFVRLFLHHSILEMLMCNSQGRLTFDLRQWQMGPGSRKVREEEDHRQTYVLSL